MQRTFITTWLLLAITFGGTARAAEPLAAAGATATPDHILLSWTGVPDTTQAISWRTDTTVRNGVVRYWVGNDQAVTTKPEEVVSKDVVTDLGKIRLFTAKLSGLTPNTSYKYQVGDGNTWSEQHTFVTADKHLDHVKFLIFGDSQSGTPENPNYAPWHTTITNAYSENKDARFLVNMGDLVEVGRSAAHWNNWFAAAKGVIDTIPEVAVEGNHETYPVGSFTSVKPQDWIDQFPTQANGPDGLKDQAYSFDYGPTHLVVLDSQEFEEKPISGTILDKQAVWLADDLNKHKDAAWKLVFFHKTPYDLKAARANEDVKQAFCPVLEDNHVDIVFNGHDHGVARTYAINKDRFVSTPSQGTIYYVTGRSGNKAYDDLSKKYWNTFFYDPQDQPNYLVVEVAGSKLTVNTYKQDKTLVDTFYIDKATDTDTDTKLNPIPNLNPNVKWVKYKNPVLAIYGNLIGAPMAHAPLQTKDGAWYIDAKAFCAYFGGSITPNADNATIIFDGQHPFSVNALNLLTDKGVLLVNVEGLIPLGFTATFHPEINVLSVVNKAP